MRFEMLFLQIFEMREEAYPEGRRRTELKNSFLEGRRFSAPVRGGKFLAATLTDSSLDPALKDRDCAELPVQKCAKKRSKIAKLDLLR